MPLHRRPLRIQLWLNIDLQLLQLSMEESVGGKLDNVLVETYDYDVPLELAVAKVLSHARAWQAGALAAGYQEPLPDV